ncbi:tRNA uridine-5-carboxymethylaminomethyl(34) synthesis GTPase MnmE [Bordetella genomosp. 9]|uniref:tRNA uridine-5-carboxymethylaminomethyl(34) synthesis GTPase MnmE n=1 Tax=Bordetella genomosp. 9 TaxID=1416803 RepID=UPI000A29267C|nr:tRNA uridine-5-carboxymethylaminomethyl(34) synthesis GTPase MnmE [Bordetella genomosp. 9]ARP92375.1 tRNA uridine-5-carboxymethylaminomethyl(34) synthesis GTPase MnmE [Bordetella genomosp. 9]
MSPIVQVPIAAIATAPGRGGVGIVRVSGAQLSNLVRRLFQRELTPRHAHLLPFKTADGEVLDEGIVLFFPAPHSYTGEDVLELQGHGGPAVLRRVLQLCLDAGSDMGLRIAEPGEFTQRAFLNGRIDLAQAEAVADLIEATSDAAARGAMASLSGVFSEKVNALADRIVHLRMLVEATLDFPEEEIDFLEKYQARPLLEALTADLRAIIAQTRQGVILREGLHVVLAGRPNVGKSSLLNALAGDEVAIVTPIAGTTRDKVVQEIHLDGIPLHVVDTAGLRDTDDPVEQIGIARTWKEIEKADVILHLQDATAAGDEDLDAGIAARLPPGTPVLEVVNKIDLLPPAEDGSCLAGGANGADDGSSVFEPEAGSALSGELSGGGNFPPVTMQLRISARTGEGLDALRKALLDIAGWNPGAESPWLARERHLRALQQAQAHLQMAESHAAQDDRVLDLFAEELRLAHESLSSITGEFTSDDLLGEIFSRFCIGK